MPITSSSFTINFNLASTPKKFVLTDTFDYVSNGIALADVKDCFTITAPGGSVIYNNSNFAAPDINRSAGAVNTTTIPLPLLPNGSVVPGTYTVVMKTQITGYPNLVTTTNTYTYNFVAPKISITQTVDCINGSFISADTTNYVVDGITPTITRNHVVYVASQPITSVSNTSATLTLGSGQFYNGIQQTVLTSTLTYVYPSGQVVTVTLTGTKSIPVDCTYFCSIYCCLRSINSNIKKYKGINDTLASEYEAVFAKVMGLVELATLAYSCGKANDVSGYVTQIQELADCDSDCACSDGAANPVYGLGGAGSGVNVAVASCNGSITVASNTVGNTTTWTICLDPALVTKINNAYNTVVSAGSGIAVADSGIIGGVRTFTVSNTVPAINMLAFKLKVTYNSGLNTVTMTVLNAQTSGSGLQSPTTLTNTFAALTPGINNQFNVSGFLTAPLLTSPYKVSAVMSDFSAPGKKGGWIQNPWLEVLNAVQVSGSGIVSFSLYDNFNLFITNSILMYFDTTFTVHFIITTN
jgi:hypothetical protein